jgi:hypothetical protein
VVVIIARINAGRRDGNSTCRHLQASASLDVVGLRKFKVIVNGASGDQVGSRVGRKISNMYVGKAYAQIDGACC